MATNPGNFQQQGRKIWVEHGAWQWGVRIIASGAAQSNVLPKLAWGLVFSFTHAFLASDAQTPSPPPGMTTSSSPSGAKTQADPPTAGRGQRRGFLSQRLPPSHKAEQLFDHHQHKTPKVDRPSTSRPKWPGIGA